MWPILKNTYDTCLTRLSDTFRIRYGSMIEVFVLHSRGLLVQMVADSRRRMGEQRTQADCERELIAIHRDTTKREQDALTQVNHQLLTQIKVLRKAQ